MRIKFLKYFFVTGLFFYTQHLLFAQPNESIRYEIDAKRGDLSYTNPDALPRAREFKRLDSTYYVGWMLEGTYKYDHAADYLGFANAATQLQKALTLLHHDYKVQLKTRTSDILTFLKNFKYHKDFDYITYALMNCYSNTDKPDSVWKLLRFVNKINLQDENYMDNYSYLAWTVHRNRFYTSTKYSFLKNSINENEQYANKLLDSGVLKIKADALLNEKITTGDYINAKMPSIWHYKSILYAYQINIPSASYYYDKLKETPYFPLNNYATFCAIQGKFKQAKQYYDDAKLNESGDKRMKEPFYYAPIMDIYKATPKPAITEITDLIKADGCTPGFGWYNIALARSLLYDGQLAESKQYIQTAQSFKEIHIGTTLGQSHYDFTATLIQLIIKQREINQLKFLNSNWWYSPTILFKMATLITEKYGLQFLIINQFALNPERNQVIYKLFSTESTISFDEVLQLIDGFSEDYFLKKFKSEIDTDTRPIIKRYYKLFAATILLKKEKYKESINYLNEIIEDKSIDYDYEKLFLFRVYEALALCNEGLNNKESASNFAFIAYKLYPQLIPTSNLKIPMRLHSSEKTENEIKIIQNLKSSNIQFSNEIINDIADVYINFKTEKNLNSITYSVKIKKEIIKPETTFSYKTPQEVSALLPLYLFNVGNLEKKLNIN